MDINEINFSSILDLVGYVGQDSAVFDETIDDNICAGLKHRLEEAEFEVLREKANAKDFWFPQDKRAIGLKGTKVSGGQRQRIAIARALSRNQLKPSLLILDEATAALDGKNEEEIQKSINSILEDSNCTIVVVAHRLSTIRKADVINVLVGGQVLERGSHEELLKIDNGIYKGMLNI